MASNTNTSQLLIPLTERRKFILFFIFLTGLSFFIGLEFVNSPYNPFKQRITGSGFEEGLILGTIVGISQWFILRKYLFSKSWILITALGWAISMFLASLVTLRLGITNSSGHVFLAIWLGFSPQWLVLRRNVKCSWIWIWISLLSAILVSTLWMLLIPNPSLTIGYSLYGLKILIVKISQSLIIGSIAAMGLCLFRKKS